MPKVCTASTPKTPHMTIDSVGLHKSDYWKKDQRDANKVAIQAIALQFASPKPPAQSCPCSTGGSCLTFSHPWMIAIVLIAKVLHCAKITSLAESSASKGHPLSKVTSTRFSSGRSRFPSPTMSSPLGPSTSNRNQCPNTSLKLPSSFPPLSSSIASCHHICLFPPLPPLDFNVRESSDGEDRLMLGSSSEDDEVIMLDDPPGAVDPICTFLPVEVGSRLRLQSYRAHLGEKGVEKIGAFERYIMRKKKWIPCSWEEEIYTHWGECIAIKGDDMPHQKDWED
ncbi:hypothetical protein ARMGADRAFT_1028253 [Armillaria gallica]|uniref:Uncharacterized protein n=1 Tax=Armillaria gallica TaxID=47427 RepID=A0A2H3DLE2_ARMGA|nr:hypothetical protein ARMGADRAFT_1028253 [Armillaria gallica]